jgi:hypothetical protein
MMNPKDYIGNQRITDYSFRLATTIQKATTISKNDLLNLYKYHLDLCIPPNALYPMSNWQSHRLCLMASIAQRLNDMTRAQQCHTLCLEWIQISDCNCCIAANQDFHHRDSCQYKIYGWWALCQAMVYLQPMTRFAYKPLFVRYFQWLAPYQQGTLKHIEFLKSKNKTDIHKPDYGKVFDPAYNNNLMKVYSQLKS